MSRNNRLRRIMMACLAASVLACCRAHAQAPSQTPDQASGQSSTTTQQDLYLDVMKSISEGRQQDADDALTRMIEQEPQHAGAWLDLAIIQCELGREKEAQHLFDFIEAHFSPPPGIMEVIRSNRMRGCKSHIVRDKWSVLLGRGYDNNVNQGASNPFFNLGIGDNQQTLELLPQYLPQSDRFTLLSAEYSRDLNQNGTIGFAQFQARENDSLPQFNTASLLVGLDRPWRIEDWNFHVIGSAGLLTLDNQLYQRQTELQLRITPPLHLPENFQFNVLTGITYSNYTSLENFDSAIDSVNGQIIYRDGKTNAQLSGGLLFDHGDAARLGGDRKGWLVNALVQRHLTDSLDAEVGLLVQNWNSQSLYSPGLIDQVRHQDTRILRVGFIMPLRTREMLRVEWRQVRDNENISLFEYKGQLLQVSLQWQNF